MKLIPALLPSLLKENKPCEWCFPPFPSFSTYIISFPPTLLPVCFLCTSFLSFFRPRLVLMSPVKSSTSCDIPWNNASMSCLRTTLAAAASWKSCPCCPHRSSVPDPASSPHRTSTAPWPSLPHSQVTGQKTQCFFAILWWFSVGIGIWHEY